MRIKKLEIHGFKSFANRATLVFGDGISGVVGPNGCGKSNVVDAIRWCMGEMSAKHLRGRAMQDVIFSGSDSRGPQGFAEVTLTFTNDGNVPPAFAAYPEIAITRRLHRDGASEYLINKTQARLRDITDFFLGTGVGTRAYSIIEQGRIGFIVNAKPEERRSLIEEVAGITKFKARKKAAERRMDATHQNLLRVNDIIAELERQLGSLRRQARKAERYRELREELRDLELHAASTEMLRMSAVERFQLGERAILESKLGDSQGAMATGELTIEADKLRLVEEERRLQDEQRVSAEIDAKLASLEKDLEHWRAQIVEARQRAEQGEQDAAEAAVRVSTTEDEAKTLSEQIKSLSGTFGEDQIRVDTIASEVNAAQSDVSEADTTIDKLRSESVEHIHAAAQHRSMLSTLGRQLDDNQRQLEQGVREKESLAEKRVELRERLEVLGGALGAGDETLSTWRSEIESARESRDSLRGELTQLAEGVQSLRDQLSDRRNRLGSLEEIARRLEGFSDGVRTLLGTDGDHAIAGIRGLVPEIMQVPAEYETAIEAALGEEIQYLVVDDQDVARRGIEHLVSVDGGRGGFVPSTPWSESSSRSSVIDPRPGVFGVALSLVEIVEGFEDIAVALLGDVVVVESLDVALGAWVGDRPRLTVTLNGEVVDRRGIVLGGTDAGAGVLANRREIRELRVVVDKLECDLQTERSKLAQGEARREELEQRINSLDASIRQAELERVERQKDLETLRSESRRFEDRDEALSYELEQWREESQRIEREEAIARASLARSEEFQGQLEEAISIAQANRRQLVENFESKSAELNRLRVDLAAREEKLSHSREGAARLESTVADLLVRQERGRTQAIECAELAEELSKKISAAEESASVVSVDAQSRRQALSEARDRFEQERQRLVDIEQELKEERRQGELVQEALLELKMDLQRLKIERDQLVAGVLERHDLHLGEILTEYHARPEPTADDVKRRRELDRQIKNMGPINLTAIEECREIEERFEFLTRQRDDLNEALENLRRAIQRINRASRERFKQAYESVNEMFQKVYPRLFRGGIARLELTNSEDLLEAGVEIVAQPPGKKLQNVNLMSGGEKALTATAFIFSIFLIKPSPFCILDEVDAPLDEANVGRFNEMLREISSIAQFIVITHNKATMTQADKLYGITMQEPGMSSVVPVDLSCEKAGSVSGSAQTTGAIA